MNNLIEQLLKLLKDALEIRTKLAEIVRQFRRDIEKIDSLAQFKKLALTLADQTDELLKLQEEQLEACRRLAEELANQTPGPTPPPNRVRPDDIANQFRTLIDLIQRDARAPRPEEAAATLKSLDIELKGLIVVDNNEAHLVPPSPDRPIEAGQLSTIRMSFGSVPVLRSVEAQPLEEPK